LADKNTANIVDLTEITADERLAKCQEYCKQENSSSMYCTAIEMKKDENGQE